MRYRKVFLSNYFTGVFRVGGIALGTNRPRRRKTSGGERVVEGLDELTAKEEDKWGGRG